MSAKNVTSYDVAQEAGVSRTTVSYVLGSSQYSEKISPDTREKVLAAADKLGYRANKSARATKTGRFNCVSMIIGEDAFLDQNLFIGLLGTLSKHDMHLNITGIQEKDNSEGELPSDLQHLMADGILVEYHESLVPVIEKYIERYNSLAVWLNINRSFNAVYTEEMMAGYKATRYLLDLGHRQIAYIEEKNSEYYPYGEHFSCTDRRNGYKKAMEELGLRPIIYHFSREMTPEDRIRKLKYELSREGRPTAILSYNWPSLVLVSLACAALGLNIPNDLSLFTIEYKMHNHTGVEINTLKVPKKEIGIESGKMMLELINGEEKQIPSVVIPYTEILEGGSCAPFHG